MREGHLAPSPPARFMPVRVTDAAPTAAASSPNDRSAAETIEILLPDGSRLRVGSEVNLGPVPRHDGATRMIAPPPNVRV